MGQFTGVSYNPWVVHKGKKTQGRSNPYKAYVRVGGKQHCLGSFSTAQAAAQAYDAAARALGR